VEAAGEGCLESRRRLRVDSAQIKCRHEQDMNRRRRGNERRSDGRSRLVRPLLAGTAIVRDGLIVNVLMRGALAAFHPVRGGRLPSGAGYRCGAPGYEDREQH
jgi:hypothetical protein